MPSDINFLGGDVANADVVANDAHGAAQQIVRHLIAAKRTFASPLNLGWVLDASRQDHKKKTYGFCVTPLDVAAWAPPQA